MEKAEIIERLKGLKGLKGYEWTDVEFKEALQDVPKNAYETVSAFANTEGGHLVFGVRQSGGGFEIVGVLEVDKVQGDFLTALRQRDKISAILDVRGELHEHEGAVLLVFHVPEASRGDKPVYLNGDIRRSFIRKGGCDVRCSENERDRFLVDSMTERFDGQAVERAPDTAFDHDSIRWYRTIYEARPGNRSHAGLSDPEFLDEMGFFVEREGTKMPNRAAILLFGNNSAFRQLLPRPVVDCQRFTLSRVQADTGARWMDRAVLDENLIRTWRALVDWYGRFAERPFRIDPASLQRDDTPPDYSAYRESMVNLLIHQDYSDHARKAEIRHYTDQTVFWNPGDAFASVADVADLLEPGEKDVRNPRIVTAFRRIGLSENAGWGLRDISRNWQQLGNVPPRIANDKSRKRFELVLLREELLSEDQILFQTSLGVRLTDQQARAFAFICRDGEATLAQLKAVTGLSGPDTVQVAERLETQRLIDSVGGAGRYALAEHLKEGAIPSIRGGARGQVDLPTRQVGQPTPDLPSRQVDQPTPRLVTDQADAPTPDLHTDQVDPPAPDLPTRQVDQPAPDLVTDQVGEPTPRLVTDQADAPAPNLVTDQVDVPETRLVTDQADTPAPNLVTDQADAPAPDLSGAQVAPLTELSAAQREIVALCDVPRSLADIMRKLGMTHRAFFRRTHLEPLLRGGVLRMVHPDQPNHPGQAYVLTEAGATLKARRTGAGAGTRGGG